jgi:hypothetical protein
VHIFIQGLTNTPSRVPRQYPAPFCEESQPSLPPIHGWISGWTGRVAVKKYKGHRMIPRENLAIVQAEFKKKQEDQLQSSFKKCYLI